MPIIPTVILNGSSGIAVGFSTNILNRNPLDVVNACIDELTGKPIKTLSPWLSEFNGTFERNDLNPKSWKILGRYEVRNTTTVKVTEIPPNLTYEKYENHLNNLVSKKWITSYEDNSSDKIEYVLKFNRAQLAEYIRKDKLNYVLKIESSETENLTTIDETGNLRIFDKVEDIVKYFVNVRLEWYQVRKDYLIQKLKRELLIISNKARFIKDIIEGKLKINNVPRKEIISYLETNKYDKLDGSFNYLLSMPIYTLTKERYEELLKQLESKKIELQKTESLKIKNMYLSDLKELKKSLKK